MKPVLFLLFLFSFTNAFADSFNLTKDGKEYLCSEVSGTNTEMAAKCADKAYYGPFNKDQSIRLCSGASSLGPAECGIKAYYGPFNLEQAVRLCARLGTTDTAECAIKAYYGPYSAEEAIQLCKANPQLLLRSLRLMESSEEMQYKIRNIKESLNLFN